MKSLFGPESFERVALKFALIVFDQVGPSEVSYLWLSPSFCSFLAEALHSPF